jgi:hypothetical protein
MTAIPSSKVNQSEKNTFISIQENTFTPQVLGSLYSDPLGDWLELLAEKEGCSPHGTWDVNSYSYGKYCYKVPYFTEQIKKYDLLPHIEDDEILNIIGNSDIQDELTRLIFKNEKNAWIKWGCSVKPDNFPRCRKLGITGGIGLPPR